MPVMPQTYTAKEVAILWKRHVVTIYTDAQKGKLPVAPIKVGSALRWSRRLVNESVGLPDDADPFAEKPDKPKRRSKASA